MNDNRQKTVDEIQRKIKAGKRLTDEEVQEHLYLARDFALLYMTTEVVAGTRIDKARVRVFNALQNAVERHELNNGNGGDDAINAMARVWQTVAQRAEENKI